MGLLDRFRKPSQAPDTPAEKPSHARRILELEARVDDLEGELEKVTRTMRQWLGRVAKREARELEKAAAAADSAPQGELLPDTGGADIAKADKNTLRRLLVTGQIRRLG